MKKKTNMKITEYEIMTPIEKEQIKQTRHGIKNILHTLYILTILSEIGLIVMTIQIWDPLFLLLLLIDILLFCGVIIIVNKEFNELFNELEETLNVTRDLTNTQSSHTPPHTPPKINEKK